MWLTWILQAVIVCISALDFRYVKPSSSSAVVCPGQPCLTLDHFTASHFTTGSTFLFLAGSHSLQTSLHLKNVSDITLRGAGSSATGSRSVVLFGKKATIVCENASNFLLKGLTFKLCEYQCEEIFAFKLIYTSHVMFSSNVFQWSGNDTLSTVWSMYSYASNITVLNCLFERNTGGAIYGIRSSLNVTGSIFTRNREGSITCKLNSVIILKETIFEHNSGPLKCYEKCTLIVTRNNSFFSNIGGGALAIQFSTLILSGNVTFSNNEALHGGAITLYMSHLLCTNGANIVLDGNKARDGGAIYTLDSSIETGECRINFVNNFATEGGGGIRISSTPHSSNKKVVISGNFTDNTAEFGSAMYIENSTEVAVKHVNIQHNAGSALIMYGSSVTFQGKSKIGNNTGAYGGGLLCINSNLTFEGWSSFYSNVASDSGGAMCLVRSNVTFIGNSSFANNSAEHNGGGLFAVAGTVIKIYGEMHFLFNIAGSGGAVFLFSEATMIVGYGARFRSAFNEALYYGGGIYHFDVISTYDCNTMMDSSIWPAPDCFIQFDRVTSGHLAWPVITSYHDSAGEDGSFLYGGKLDWCILRNLPLNFHQLMIDKDILTVISKDNTTQAIASDPLALCFCDGANHSPDCTTVSRRIVIHRGQKFTVSLLAYGQLNSVVSAWVIAIPERTARLEILQNHQYIPRHCSNVTYNLYSNRENEMILLYAGPCHTNGNNRILLDMTLLPCIDGFILDSDGHCVCEERLREYNVSCTIAEDVYLTRKAGSRFWMGAEYINESYQGLILYETCPVEYCRTDEVNMTLHDIDLQCAEGRIGVLCGGCAENYSLLIGSSKCKECSSTYLVLLLPFAAAGIALVAFLSIIRLTVATGMINCLVLYANVVQVNRKIFFPANSNNILTVFIAWLNLDLAFETCFYDGMDAFAQTCLQFAFPVYVWVLISLIIITSRYSITVSKLIGHNPIAVLATLLFMSYTKVLKIIIEVYSSATLDYPQNKTVTLWLKDANVTFLKSKHLALTVVTSLILVIFFVPYTLFLLFGFKLYRYSGKKRFRWFNRFKPLLDSYYAPYKINTRYWTGSLLLVRCALYIVFSLNSSDDSNKSLLAIIVTFTAIGFVIGFLIPGRIYKNFGVNILEASSYLNLISLSAVTLAQLGHKTKLVYTMVGIVFATTLWVIAYHFYVLYLANSTRWLKIKEKINSWTPNPVTTSQPTGVVSVSASSHDPHKLVTKTVIELREPLLETEI